MSSLAEAQETLPYYTFDKVWSFNAVFNFVVGARGLGKTFGAKKFVIKDAIKRGNQFIYLRRYRTELNGRGTFFADIEQEFPDYDLRVNGNVAEYAPIGTRDEKKRKWTIMGYFVSLSTAQTQKSIAYPKVKTIIYDEFIIEKGALHYLPDEAIAFNNFFSTVDRWKDKTRVLFLANSVSIMNPYFLEYDIKPDEEGEFVQRRDGFILCHFVDSELFGTAVYRTKFGKFIAGSEYADYSVGNQFKDNHDAMLDTKSSNAVYTYTLETRQGIFSVWIDYGGPMSGGPFFYIQERRPKQELLFTLVDEWMTSEKTLVTTSDKLMQYLRSGFRNGKAFFDSSKSRNAFTEVFRR